ncbi:MAG: M3 family metallopeptidase [Bacteroidales bacterium]|nr:M3 family metallopeptidase [Candidatus Cryptobacteroides choladohippi]
MKRIAAAACIALAAITSCKMENPLLTESPLPYGAPQFDKIENKHYMPAFEQGIKEAKAEIDAIVANPAEPTFENTIQALEESGRTLNNVASIFYNILEADTNEELQAIAEKISPMMTEYSMYVSLNEPLFQKVKAVYEKRDGMDLDPDQAKLLEDTFKGFARGGANLSPEDKEKYSKIEEELSLVQLTFGNNVLAATNAYTLNITDEEDLAGLPDFVKDQGKAAAAEKGVDGWVFDLSYPSYSPFMQYSTNRELRRQMYMAYNTKAVGGEFDNLENTRKIVDLRIQSANLLGYGTYADYALEDRMAKDKATVNSFLAELLAPSVPAAKAEVEAIYRYAKENGFDDTELRPWDFSYWSEKYKDSKYSINDEMLKPYFKLENCIPAVFDLANRLYGLNFTERPDIPGYNKDVKVYDVTDGTGRHMALFYADFFPRASKRGGAWMTEFRGQSIVDGVEYRPFISIVTNFTKPTETEPSLLTHYELTTFLHEFGHAIHGMLAEGRYGSQTGTSVARDFVELPSQIMENWGYEPEYLNTFAKHYQTGETIPEDLIAKIVESKNYLAAYMQVRQLQFGILDMAWHTLTALPEQGTIEFEKAALAPSSVIYSVPECCISTSFNHIFTGGYSAGYYSYKWAEVLEADAFSLFKEKGIFNREVADSFRENILSKGSTCDEAVLYRNFRGHDPQPQALLEKLGIVTNK